MTTFNRLNLDDQIRVLKKVRNYPTLKENLELLMKVDPVLNVRKTGAVRFTGNFKKMVENINL